MGSGLPCTNYRHVGEKECYNPSIQKNDEGDKEEAIEGSKKMKRKDIDHKEEFIYWLSPVRPYPR